MKRMFTFLVIALALSLVPVIAFAQGNEMNDAEREVRASLKSRGFTEVSAAPVPQLLHNAEIDPETYALAYSDIDSASPEQREKILAARRQVAYSVDEWVADTEGSYIASIDYNTMEWHEPPKFSELFPGWDPVLDPESAPAEEAPVVESMMAPLSVNASSVPVVYSVQVPKQTDGVMAAPFHTVTNDVGQGLHFTEYITSLTNCSAINLGVSNMDVTPNANIYWRKNAVVGQGIEGQKVKNQPKKLGFRTSVYGISNASAMISLQIDRL